LYKQLFIQEEEKEKAAIVVVGYESKMFRDDETAAKVNEGKFLVPWMGDKSLMIDRYDVRLLLDDRKAFKKVKITHTKVLINIILYTTSNTPVYCET
jgi:hypothetical protein